MLNDVDASVVPTATSVGTKVVSPATGPKYNDDAELLASDDVDLEEADESDNDDDEESDIVKEIENESDEDEEDSEEPDKEDEDSEEDIKKRAIPFDRPSIKDIKAKYPNFFKDFPELKESYFRELEFTQLFPTVDDAKEAFNDNEAFNVLSEAALSGDPEPLLESIGKTDAKALEIFSLSFLPALYKKNSEMYTTVVTPLFQNLVQQLYKDKDENTRNAALVLSDWIFGENDGEAVAKSQKSVAKSLKLNEEQQRIKAEKETQTTQAFRQSAGKVSQTVEKSLESLIFKSPSFDPDRVFSPALRRMGAKEAIKTIMARLQTDPGHMAVMSARWKRARANGYTADDESKIVSTYLARAKSLISGVAGKVSSDMLGTKKAAAVVKSGKAVVFPKQSNSGKPASNGRNREPVDYSKMSDMDILNS